VEEERLQHEARWFASLASYGKRNRNDLRDAMMMTRVPRNALSSSGLPGCAAREGPVANALVMFGSSCSALSNRASPNIKRREETKYVRPPRAGKRTAASGVAWGG